jgi:limonene-1,2-epoxide hydrolase
VSEQHNIGVVTAFFRAWEDGPYEKFRAAYDTYLADDCVYENCGLPPCEGKATALALADAVTAAMDLQSITVEIRGLAAAGDLVFSERVDHHFDSKGQETVAPAICGVMRIRDGRIAEWRDYFDPGPVLAHLAAGAATSPGSPGA